MVAELLEPPTDNYDVAAWNQFYQQNPHYRRSVGAEGDNPADPPADPPPSNPPSDPPADPPPSDPPVDKAAQWRADIQDEKVRKFAENFNSVEEAVKASLNFRQKLSNAVHIPGDDTSDEERETFYKRLGRPESADKYDIELSETLTEEDAAPLVSMLRETLFESGIPKIAGERILTQLFGKGGLYDKAEEEETNAWNRNIEEARIALKKEWGDDFDTNTKYAARGIATFGGDDLKNLLDQATINKVELSNHPLITKTFAEIGRRMGESGLQFIASESDHQSFDEEQNRLTTEALDAQHAGDYAKADRLFQERDQKARAFYGG